MTITTRTYKIPNFRDVAVSTSAKFLIPGRIYRSAAPDLSSNVNSVLIEHNIKTIIDLRSRTEVQQYFKFDRNSKVDNEVSSDITESRFVIRQIDFLKGFHRRALWNHSTLWTKLIVFLLLVSFQKARAIKYLVSSTMNPGGLVTMNEWFLMYCGGAIRNVFMQFTDFENYPILIHCTQGKDRTGIIIALLLDICHVPSDLIIQDYVVSSSELKVERPIMLKTFSAVGLDPVFADSPGYAIKDTLAMIRTKYRSAQEYLIGIGVDMEMQHRVRQNVMTGGKRTKI